jgi:hypothetical protein
MASPCNFALTEQPLLPIPIIVLYLAPHVRTLSDSSHRLDKSPMPKGLKYHQSQANYLRRLPPSILP